MKVAPVLLGLLLPAATLLAEHAGAAPVRYSLLQSEATAEGVVLRWAFDKAAEISAVRVERAAQLDGPWSPVPGEPRLEGDRVSFVDAAVPSRSTFWYRLAAPRDGAGDAYFGPVAGNTRGAPKKLEITALDPNPSAGPLVLDYAVPKPGRLKIALVDLQGRIVAMLVDADRAAGLYHETWVAAFAKNATPGLHFVRLDLAGKKTSRSVILAP